MRKMDALDDIMDLIMIVDAKRLGGVQTDMLSVRFELKKILDELMESRIANKSKVLKFPCKKPLQENHE